MGFQVPRGRVKILGNMPTHCGAHLPRIGVTRYAQLQQRTLAGEEPTNPDDIEFRACVAVAVFVACVGLGPVQTFAVRLSRPPRHRMPR